MDQPLETIRGVLGCVLLRASDVWEEDFVSSYLAGPPKAQDLAVFNDWGNTSTCLERDPAGGVIQQGTECLDLVFKRREVEDGFC